MAKMVYTKQVALLLLSLLLLALLVSCDQPHSDHLWSEWVTAKPATCEAAGEQYRTCDCGETQTAPIPALDHEAGDWKTIMEATKDEDGMQVRECIHCTAILESAIIPAWGKDETLVDYTITIKTAGGMPLSGITVEAYADETLTSLKGGGRTNTMGVATISLPSDKPYWAVLKGNALEGYSTQPSYDVLDTTTTITLTSSVISNPSAPGLSYELGDIMHDFTVVDCNGNTFQLSEVLKTKEMVLINFWYINCSWCVKEFPYMQSVYEEYSDKVAIIALNPNSADTNEEIKAFQEEKGLTFPMAQDTAHISIAFSEYLWGYPTSVVVDRYGMICIAEAGGIVSEEPFRAIFDHFTGTDYQQAIIENISDLLPAKRVTMKKKENI